MKDINCNLNLKALLEYEHLSGKSFFEIKDNEEEMLFFAYAVFRANNPDHRIGFEGFLTLLQNKSFVNTFITQFKQQASELSLGHKVKEPTSGDPEEIKITIEDIVNTCLVDMNLPPKWLLEEMPLWMIEGLFETYHNKVINQMGQDRVTHFFQVLPMLGFAKNNKIREPQDLYPLPGEETKEERKKRELLAMSESLKGLFKKKKSDNPAPSEERKTMAKNELQLILDDNEIQAALGKLQKIDKNKAVKTGLNRAIDPIYQAEKSEVSQHVVTGNLLRSMTKRLQAAKQRIYVGYRRGKKTDNIHDPERKGYHAHLLEQGTVIRRTKAGYNRGSVRKGSPKTGWYQAKKAFQTHGSRALNILMNTIKKEIQRIVGISLVLLMLSCTKTVYVPVEKVRTDTIIHNNTLVERDTIYQSEKIVTLNDTVYIDRYKYKERTVYKWKTDSVLKVDSIPYPVPTPVEVEVVKYKTPGWVYCFFIMLAVGIAGWLYRRFKNVKELLD